MEKSTTLNSMIIDYTTINWLVSHVMFVYNYNEQVTFREIPDILEY